MSILHRRRRVAARIETPAAVYTRESLEDMSAADVRSIVEAMGQVHQNKETSIDLILAEG